MKFIAATSQAAADHAYAAFGDALVMTEDERAERLEMIQESGADVYQVA